MQRAPACDQDCTPPAVGLSAAKTGRWGAVFVPAPSFQPAPAQQPMLRPRAGGFYVLIDVPPGGDRVLQSESSRRRSGEQAVCPPAIETALKRRWF